MPGTKLPVSDEWYRWMVQSVTGYALFSTNLEGKIVTWDIGAEALFGYRRDEVRGEDARFIFTPADISRHVPEKEMTAATEHHTALDERWHVKKEGTIFWASGLMMRLHDDHRRHVGYVKIIRERPPPNLG